MKSLSIIVPCYNEENTILRVLQSLSAVNLGGVEKQIIVVNDASTDGTKLIIEEFKKYYPQITLISHQKNLGKTAAIVTGLTSATGEYTIIQDADLEYDPNDIAQMADYAAKNNLPALYGSRRLNKKNIYSSCSFYLGANLITLLGNFLYKQKLTDIETCYKLIRTDLLKNFSISSGNFVFENEVTAKIADLGYVIPEVPIHYSPRTKNEGKKIKFRHGFEAVWYMISHKLKRQ